MAKQLLWNLIWIRYGWALTRLLYKINFELEYALSFKKGNTVSLKHNHVRNFTTTLLNKICKGVQVEPQLQQRTGETLQRSAAAGNDVLLNINAWGVWETSHMTCFDVGVFNPNTKQYANLELSKAYEINGREKKRKCNEYIFQVAYGSFSPRRNEP